MLNPLDGSVLEFFNIRPPPVLAIGDDRYSRPSLKGLKKLSVLVKIEEPLSEDFKKAGLTKTESGPV